MQVGGRLYHLEMDYFGHFGGCRLIVC
jgi:hypothetical protein